MRLMTKLLISTLLSAMSANCLQAKNTVATTNEKIDVTASSWTHNRKTGMNIFLGSVTINQGNSKHVTATKVITKQIDDKHLEEMTAFGDTEKPAHYWDSTKPNEPVLHAYANTIIYNIKKGLITLKGNAHVQQGQNQFKGNLIYYNMREQTIIAPKMPNSRTTIIYQPT